jgi:PAS domain S-box-containing protein
MVAVLHQLFDRALTGIVVIQDERVYYANAAAARLLDVLPTDVVGMGFIDMLGRDYQDLVRGALEETGSLPGYIDIFIPHRTARGVVVSAGMRPAEVVPGTLVDLRDVTHQRALAYELGKTKEFLENLIQASVDGIVAFDPTGHVVLFNRAAELLLEYRAVDAVGLLHLSDLTSYPLLDTLRSCSEGRLQLSRQAVRNRSGVDVVVNLSAALIYEGKSEVAAVAILSDQRERMVMEAKLRRSEREAAVVELAGTAAHELNQPLTSVMGYVGILARQVAYDSPMRKAVDMITGEANRMAEIVRRLGRITDYRSKEYIGDTTILDIREGE